MDRNLTLVLLDGEQLQLAPLLLSMLLLLSLLMMLRLPMLPLPLLPLQQLMSSNYVLLSERDGISKVDCDCHNAKCHTQPAARSHQDKAFVSGDSRLSVLDTAVPPITHAFVVSIRRELIIDNVQDRQVPPVSGVR
jgi:hypothetical protein